MKNTSKSSSEFAYRVSQVNSSVQAQATEEVLRKAGMWQEPNKPINQMPVPRRSRLRLQ